MLFSRKIYLHSLSPRCVKLGIEMLLTATKQPPSNVNELIKADRIKQYRHRLHLQMPGGLIKVSITYNYPEYTCHPFCQNWILSGGCRYL